MSTVFVEYAWDMGWCDPCAADPLSRDELRNLGVFWLDASPAGPRRSQNVFITRLHVRYDNAHFPEDLVFQETADRENVQARYVVRDPRTGDEACSSANRYRFDLQQRKEREAQTLATLTGWSLSDIRKKMGLISAAGPADQPMKWWQLIWR